MNVIKLLVAVLLGALVLILSGCPASMSGSAYSRSQARQTQEVTLGTVDSVRRVQIEGTKSPVGSGAGAVVGGIAGSTIGSGRGSTVGAVLGAVGGGLAGAAVEEATTRKTGLEITVKQDNGKLVAITQEADEEFRPGERVRILSGGGVTRVTH